MNLNSKMTFMSTTVFLYSFFFYSRRPCRPFLRSVSVLTCVLTSDRFPSFLFPPSILSDWFQPSLDDKTAQKLLWISEGGSKVARTSDAVCPYPNRPERYDHSPQVRRNPSLCCSRRSRSLWKSCTWTWKTFLFCKWSQVTKLDNHWFNPQHFLVYKFMF